MGGAKAPPNFSQNLAPVWAPDSIKFNGLFKCSGPEIDRGLCRMSCFQFLQIMVFYFANLASIRH